MYKQIHSTNYFHRQLLHVPKSCKILYRQQNTLSWYKEIKQHVLPFWNCGEALDKGQGVFYLRTSTPMMATKYRAYKDEASGKQKVFHVLSICYQPAMEEVNVYSRDGSIVRKPTVIKAYNVHMGWVDRFDQQLHMLQCLRKSYKRYRKLAFHLIAQMVLNSRWIVTKYLKEKQESKCLSWTLF